jgi:hypothetical protein
MAKIIQVRAPKKTSIARLSETEISRLVASEAGKYLNALPADVRPVGVSALSLASNPASDVGFWAEWTRDCADQAGRIDQYTDPGPEDIAQLTAASLEGQKIQSILTIRPAGTETGQ